MGSLTVAHALRAAHGARVALWGGPETGWLTPHPMALFGLGGALTCGTHKLDDWEGLTLHVLDAPARTVALRSVHGRFVCVSPDGRVACDKAAIGGWERLTLTQATPGSVTLSTREHGRPMFVGAAGGTGMHARADAAVGAARFALLDMAAARARFAHTNPALRLPAEPAAGGGALSPLAIAGIVAGSLLGAAALAGGIAAGVVASQQQQQQQQQHAAGRGSGGGSGGGGGGNSTSAQPDLPISPPSATHSPPQQRWQRRGTLSMRL